MSEDDFFDSDARSRAAGTRGPGIPAPDAVETIGGASTRGDVRAISDFNITRMARHKQQVNEQSAAALQELDRLKKRQEQIEQEKRALEDLRRKHEDFERGRQEMTDHLKRSLLSLEREEVEYGRLVELLDATRKRFKELLSGIEEIKEETWPEPEIRDHLTRSLAVIEDSRMEYNKALAKIDAVKGGDAGAPAPVSGVAAPLPFSSDATPLADQPFSFWVKAGLAFTLPLVIALLLIGGAILLAARYLP